MLGQELQFDPSLSRSARFYCRLMGVPIVGLRIRWRWIRDHLPKQAHRILDAGCGRGVISRAIAAHFPAAQVDAIDIDANRQEINSRIAQQAHIDNCRFFTQDIQQLSTQAGYDLVVSVDNLEHIEDDQAGIENLFNALEPGGLLLVHVPHFYRHWPVFKRTENFDVPGHFRVGYHLPELTERLRRSGFDVEHCAFTYGFIQTLANNISYAITGAREKNQLLYALAFPVLNVISWLGHGGKPGFGAGVIALARKPISGAKPSEPAYQSDMSGVELD